MFISKGNIPQGLFSLESFNHVYGEARNPYDINRTSGGSSGGEAALVRLGLVNAALGSDIAGSLRIPALFCGVYTLKPTALRIPILLMTQFFESHNFGRKPCNGFDTNILPTVGPITRSVDDIEILMTQICDGIQYDLFSPPLGWHPVKDLPLKVGVLKEFNIVPVCTAGSRALNQCVDILKKKKVEIVDIDINDIIEEIIMYTFASYM